MARVGGRNSAFAWIVGILCAGVVGVLAWIAAPLMPVAVQFVADQLNPPTSEPAAGSGGAGADDPQPSECRDLYPGDLWSELTRTEDAVLTPSDEWATSAASGLLDALTPTLRFTCAWTGDERAVVTSLADVPADAGAIAETALPALGFTCAPVEVRTRCVREDGQTVETIETGGGLWVMSVESGWRPDRYADRVAAQVWPVDS